MRAPADNPVARPDGLAAAFEALLGLAEASLRQSGGPWLRRVEVPRPPSAKPLAWLQAQAPTGRLYWSSRDRDFQVAAVGQADDIHLDTFASPGDAIAAATTRLGDADPGIRCFGGLRFSPRQPADDRWSSFGAARFVVPRIEYGLRSEAPYLALNFSRTESPAELMRSVQALRIPPPGEEDTPPLPAPDYRVDRPDAAQWESRILAALAAFEQGSLSKVVLARRASFHFARPLDALALLRRLRRVTPECFHFCFQGASGQSFIGASPERLYIRHGRRIASEAVAGTRPRGSSTDTDRSLAAQLLGSEKDQREHAYVREAILAAMAPLCARWEHSREPSLLQLARGQHLYTAFSGELREGVSDAQIVAALHPTPAVGGSPTPEALRRIPEWEGFDRGWYAAPVGWIGADEADFSVAIRSGLVENERLDLFSGAGIVAGSTPRAEWEEIENKISDFIRILTGP